MINLIVIALVLLILVFIIRYLNRRINKLLIECGINIGIRKVYLGFVIICSLLIYFKSAFVVVIFYMLLLFPIFDFIKWSIVKINNKNILKFIDKVYLKGFLVIILSFIIVILGIYNSRNTEITTYEISVNKEFSDINLIMLSDIHYGTGCSKKQLENVRDLVNKQNADVICLVGDIFDESTSKKQMDEASKIFSEMKSKYGMYYVTGNHDARYFDKFYEKFKQCNISVLRDQAVLVNNSFYLVGRNDKGMNSDDESREELSKIMKDIDMEKPVIVLDHRPIDSDEEEKCGVDLQLSGHTHDGQIFPGNLFVGLFNDLAYGHQSKGTYNIIVGSGIGTWGFPVRTAGHSEIVKVILQGIN